MAMAGVGGEHTPVRSGGSMFGITPGATPAQTPVPGGGPPDGKSPNSKRPLNRETIQMAVSDTRVLGNEDLSAAVHTLYSNSERDQKWTNSIAESVHWNAQLMDKVVERVNALEAALTASNVKLDDTTSKVEVLQNDLRKVGDLAVEEPRPPHL